MSWRCRPLCAPLPEWAVCPLRHIWGAAPYVFCPGICLACTSGCRRGWRLTWEVGAQGRIPRRRGGGLTSLPPGSAVGPGMLPSSSSRSISVRGSHRPRVDPAVQVIASRPPRVPPLGQSEHQHVSTQWHLLPALCVFGPHSAPREISARNVTRGRKWAETGITSL